jgi:hypothetical protein
MDPAGANLRAKRKHGVVAVNRFVPSPTPLSRAKPTAIDRNRRTNRRHRSSASPLRFSGRLVGLRSEMARSFMAKGAAGVANGPAARTPSSIPDAKVTAVAALKAGS